MSVDDIVGDFPHLTPDDIADALCYAAAVVDDRTPPVISA